MPIPSQPTIFVPRPFANNGDWQNIPDSGAEDGRASFQSGFPPITQLPLSQGGKAPNRTDFNGILNIISAFTFWQQSGGMMTYKSTLNYQVPAIVYYNNDLWWCVATNGPEAPSGQKVPGSDSNYWITLSEKLFGGGDDPVVSSTPVGTIIWFYGLSAPDGYFACDGRTFSAADYPKLYTILSSSQTPNFSGYFFRCIGGSATGAIGTKKAASIGPHAHTGIRPPASLTGLNISHDSSMEDDVGVSRTLTNGVTATTGSGIGSETAPMHALLLACIKHD